MKRHRLDAAPASLSSIPLAAIFLAGVVGVCLPSFTTPEAATHGPLSVQLPPHQVEVVGLDSKSEVADWGHAAIGVREAWKVTKGRGAIVAVLDTGMDFKHPDLRDRYAGFKDFTNSWWNVWDQHGHGTHCAGVVAASENGSGVVGVAPEARLLIGKVLGERGSGSSQSVADGIDWAVSQGAHIISLSLGASGQDPVIHAAIKRAAAAGVIVVAAAGNSGPREGTVDYPGGYPECVCVAAVDGKLNVAKFSSRGPQVDIAAPGVDVQSCYPGGQFAKMSGTSMATPYVAGVAALYVGSCLDNYRKPSPDEFAQRLHDSARDLAPKGKDTASGAGLVQPAKVVWVPVEEAPPPREVKASAAAVKQLIMQFDPPADFLGLKLKRLIFEFDDTRK